MKETKIMPSKRIDSRIFEQNTDFPHFIDLTPTLKNTNSITIKKPATTMASQKWPSELSNRIQTLEDKVEGILKHLQSLVKDHLKKYNEVLQKIQTIKQKDEDIELLIERHNQIVQTFQNKVNQLQHLIEKQEIKLINTQSALHEAHLHLENLKRENKPARSPTTNI